MNYHENCLLIVDDEAFILNMLADYFAGLSYTVLTAANAEAAMKLLNSGEKVSLIITDIDLPGISGIELLKITRETRPEVPVVIITGLKTLDFAISAIKHGAQDYIPKPFELGEVRKVVEKVLRYRKRSEKKDRIFQYASAMNINFDIPTKDIDASVVASYLARFLLNAGFCSKDEFHQFYVAFMETLINAIEHGNLELPSSIKGSDFEKITFFEELREQRMKAAPYNERMVRVAFMFNPRCFSLTVTDEGPGFDWQQYHGGERHNYQVSTKPYGRGFMLIHHIIDEVYFNEKGNAITLVKSNDAEG
ncbi:MAG: response regulator [Calditrichaeota bacterium]|nr:response regulator [Calditrichota bacterium]MCB0288698.1 response regulator [Calditrichota bacterium]MCB0302625.1 response regulator [Calditrichota bacterium]MCB0313346.1 response regulator [Calditrichota bacterium]MCB9088421.1 response regulator [Calditrichia bacterium]